MNEKFTDENGTECRFVKINENSQTAEFVLRSGEISKIEFIPKVSITLDRDLIFNIYVPLHEMMIDLLIDGVSLADEAENLEIVQIGGMDHFLISVNLPAAEAAREIEMVCRFAINTSGVSQYANATFTFSTVEYATKVLADGSEVEKQLVRDVLSYVRAAYDYFGTVDTEAISEINSILGNGYDEANRPTVGAAENTTVYFTGATLVLDGTPSIRFYLPGDAADITFFVDGIKANVVYGTDTNGNYAEIDVYAHAMCGTVTYTVNGESGTYNVASYYEFAAASSNAKLTAIVERLMKYCESAKAYKLAMEGTK
jgi:hypothetical protein